MQRSGRAGGKSATEPSYPASISLQATEAGKARSDRTVEESGDMIPIPAPLHWQLEPASPGSNPPTNRAQQTKLGKGTTGDAPTGTRQDRTGSAEAGIGNNRWVAGGGEFEAVRGQGRRLFPNRGIPVFEKSAWICTQAKSIRTNTKNKKQKQEIGRAHV